MTPDVISFLCSSLPPFFPFLLPSSTHHLVRPPSIHPFLASSLTSIRPCLPHFDPAFLSSILFHLFAPSFILFSLPSYLLICLPTINVILYLMVVIRQQVIFSSIYQMTVTVVWWDGLSNTARMLRWAHAQKITIFVTIKNNF